jgi:phage repressor protein C with HTH and peptisase S24 domain
MTAQRISQYIENKGVAVYLVEDKLGLGRGTLSKSIKGDRSIGSTILENFLENFPDINPIWLLTGKGEMLMPANEESDIYYPDNKYLQRSDVKRDLQEIKLYDFKAAAGINSLFNHHADVLGSIKVPNLPKCDGAISIVGDSMYPLLKSGDIVIYKMVQNLTENIFWGEMYLLAYSLDGDEIVTVKFIQKSDLGDEYIKLVSQNSNHQPKDVKLQGIIKMAMVKASIRINGMA